MNLITCPKCHNIIAYNSYFNAYYCSKCGFFKEEENENNTN